LGLGISDLGLGFGIWDWGFRISDFGLIKGRKIQFLNLEIPAL
jgi:hypothetical protein